MVDIFDEVEEELREERMQAFLKKYGGVLFAGCLMVIGAVGGWKAWGWHEDRQNLDAAARYIAATARIETAGLAGPNRPEAIAAFEAIAANAPDGYRVLALLRASGLRADSGDLRGAAALWDQIAADKSADPLLRDLASLIWCLYHVDDGDPAVVEGRLKPLAAPGAAWRSLALEQLALLDLRQGRTEAARTQLKKLVEDTTAPNGVRGRAGALLDRVGG
ncbi:MAG: tetratricopeptide repeat protein [Acetobacteraceae bacterium]|nr:tetratricopeptide repeat protein [Acetobacteraceae bacterium]